MRRRIVKEPEERKNEILNAAELLFAAKGFESATVNDILAAVSIAKGTLYYYFKSKEDVLDALIDRRIQEGINKANEISASPLSPEQKLLAIIMAQKARNETQKDFNSVLHETDNAKMHQKALTQCVIRLSPCLARVVEEGVSSGIFSTPFPAESAEILLAAALVLFDDDFFQWTEREKAGKIAAFLTVMERSLAAKTGSFADFAKAFE